MKSSVSHGRPRLTARLQILALIAGLSLPLLSGCPGGLEGVGWPPPTGTGGMTGTGTGGTGAGTGGAGGPCDAETKYLKDTTPLKGCAAAGCHVPGAFKPDLTTDPWGAMFMQNATAVTCNGMPLINSSKPASGVLIKRLAGAECGASMPFGSPVDPVALECITSWVNSKLP